MAAYDINADPGYHPSCARCKKLMLCIDYKARSTRVALGRKRASDEAVARLVRN